MSYTYPNNRTQKSKLQNQIWTPSHFIIFIGEEMAMLMDCPMKEYISIMGCDMCLNIMKDDPLDIYYLCKVLFG